MSKGKGNPKVLNLVWYWHEFCNKSGAVLPVLTLEGGERYDWGLTEIALDGGAVVHIRPATDVERGAMALRLLEVEGR